MASGKRNPELLFVIRKDLGIVTRAGDRYIGQCLVDQSPAMAIRGVDVDQDLIDRCALGGVRCHRIGVFQMFIVVQVPTKRAARVVKGYPDISALV